MAEHSLHGKITELEYDGELPQINRRDFADAKNLQMRIDSEAGKTLFFPIHVTEYAFPITDNKESQYTIVIYGITRDGNKIVVVIENIKPHFAIAESPPSDGRRQPPSDGRRQPPSDGRRQPPSDDQHKTAKSLIKSFGVGVRDYSERIAFYSDEIIRGKLFKGYQEHNDQYVKLAFDDQFSRSNAIKRAKAAGYTTFNDGGGSYYTIVSAEHQISFGTWNILRNYQIIDRESRASRFLVDAYVIDGTRLSTSYIRLPIEHLSSCWDLKQDKTMIMTWDIETWSPDHSVPTHADKDHCMFMMGLTFHWCFAQAPLLRICLTSIPAAPNPNHWTILCAGERGIICAMAEIWRVMKPDYVVGFNDSEYDWPWLVNRAKYHNVFVHFIQMVSMMKRDRLTTEQADKYYTALNMKFEPGVQARSGHNLCVPGCIPLDARKIFRALYPAAESSSLKWFLARLKLPSKVDMPYAEIFKACDDYFTLCGKDPLRLRATQTACTTTAKSAPSEYDLDVIIPGATIRKSDAAVVTPVAAPMATHICLTKAELLDKFSKIGEYCVGDAERCHDLLYKRNLIMDRRGVADIGYCSTYDCYYRADGFKVRNLVMARGHKQGLMFSSAVEYTGSEKYPGAIVLPPEKNVYISKFRISEHITRLTLPGVGRSAQEWKEVTDAEIKRAYAAIEEHGPQVPDEVADTFAQPIRDHLREPILSPLVALDFASLYPSIIMAYNLSPEFIITDPRQAEEMGKIAELHHINFEYDGRPINAWSILKFNDRPAREFGIYPTTLKELFDARSVIKKQLAAIVDQIDAIRAAIIALKPGERREDISGIDKLSDLEYQQNYLNSKQTAMKVFMNTFYGETGSKNSPFFMLPISGGTTSMGQVCLKNANKLASEQKCHTRYGDTDSLYFTLADSHFVEIGKQFYTDKIDRITYWTGMIRIVMQQVKIIRDTINAWFEKFTGTKFLNMSFEEVVYPAHLCAKKKYYGFEHAKVIDFRPREIFMRGLELKKRGVAEILKVVCDNIIRTILSPDNLYTILELVVLKIAEIYQRKWQPRDFVKTDVFRPGKNNVKVVKFVDRMAARGIKVPPFDRFEYVIVQKYPFEYDFRGRQIPLSLGDKMEMPETVDKLGLTIDLDYYMKSGINGQLARFLTHCPQFYNAPTEDTDDAVGLADKQSLAAANKFVGEQCHRHYRFYTDQGGIRKSLFRQSNKMIEQSLTPSCGSLAKVICANNADNVVDMFITAITKQVEKECKHYSVWYMQYMLPPKPRSLAYKEEIAALIRIYEHRGSLQYIQRWAEQSAIAEVRRKIDAITGIYRVHTWLVESVIDAASTHINFGRYEIPVPSKDSPLVDVVAADDEDDDDVKISKSQLIKPTDEMPLPTQAVAESIQMGIARAQDSAKFRELIQEVLEIGNGLRTALIFRHRIAAELAELYRLKEKSVGIVSAPPSLLEDIRIMKSEMP